MCFKKSLYVHMYIKIFPIFVRTQIKSSLCILASDYSILLIMFTHTTNPDTYTHEIKHA